MHALHLLSLKISRRDLRIYIADTASAETIRKKKDDELKSIDTVLLSTLDVKCKDKDEEA